MVIRSVGVLSIGKIQGCIMAIFGLIAGGLVSLMAVAGMAANRPGGGPDAGVAMMAMGMGAIVILPLMYGAIGFVGGVISGLVYNVVASIIGGIEFEIEHAQP